QGDAAPGLAGQNAVVLVPLIGQARASRDDGEAGTAVWTIGGAGRVNRNHEILVHRQGGAVGQRTSANPADHYAVSGGVCPGDVGQGQAAPGLAAQRAGTLIPLIAQTRSGGRHAKGRAGSGTVSQASWPGQNRQIRIYGEGGAVRERGAAGSADDHAVS